MCTSRILFWSLILLLTLFSQDIRPQMLRVRLYQELGWLYQCKKRGDLRFKFGSLCQSCERRNTRWCLSCAIRQKLRWIIRVRSRYIEILQVWRLRKSEEVRHRLLQWRFVQWRQSTNGQRHHVLGMRPCSFSSLILRSCKTFRSAMK